MFRPRTAGLRQAMVSIYRVELVLELFVSTMAVSDWCITNLAQSLWVSVQSVVGTLGSGLFRSRANREDSGTSKF